MIFSQDFSDSCVYIVFKWSWLTLKIERPLISHLNDFDSGARWIITYVHAFSVLMLTEGSRKRSCGYQSIITPRLWVSGGRTFLKWLFSGPCTSIGNAKPKKKYVVVQRPVACTSVRSSADNRRTTLGGCQNVKVSMHSYHSFALFTSWTTPQIILWGATLGNQESVPGAPVEDCAKTFCLELEHIISYATSFSSD